MMKRKLLLTSSLILTLLSPLAFGGKTERSPRFSSRISKEDKLLELQAYYTENNKTEKWQKLQTTLTEKSKKEEQNKIIDEAYRRMENCLAAKRTREKTRKHMERIEKETRDSKMKATQAERISERLLARNRLLEKSNAQLESSLAETLQELDAIRKELKEEKRINDRLLGTPYSHIPEGWQILP